MKIIKQGDINRLKEIKRFECKSCGCIFEAENAEYKREYSQRDDCGWYAIKCPTCQTWVTTDYEVAGI